MAEINNYSEISENFDTIKTLLNSIRAQGILNTSDVDKLLSGINSKLEKINTEDDIELIKVFLSELKSNLDERHSVLISKFGAIESLFSNLLKNSSETLKSSEVKELFDIVATNLSVFSREVVSQKEILTDITLRLDNIQSDDSKKKEVIKNITNLKTDIEHLNNGFDSIVLSLNENFKTVLKSIADVDQTDMVTKFGEQITNIVTSSNTILSALQLLDKKNGDVEAALKGLATQEDLNNAKRSVIDLTTKNQELANSVQSLVEKSYKMDSLSEKIDASVDIVAGLKSAIIDNDEQSTHSILDKLLNIENSLRDVSSTRDFDTLQKSLDSVIREILNSYVLNITNIGEDIKYKVAESNDKLAQILEANITRTISDLTSNTDSLGERIQESQNSIAGLCKSSFGDITDAITGLKNIISQLDENNVSSNNAIFSNITDRLAIFENSLKNSLEKQEDFVSNSSEKLVEQLSALKQISDSLDYKMDSSVIEINNAKQELSGLKGSIDEVLALDFINAMKNLKVDLYAIKQDLTELTETTGTELSEKLQNDMFGKYELLISRLDNVEDEVKSVQKSALSEIHTILDKISSSIVDILSYVSVRAENSTLELDSKLADIAKIVKDNNLSYIENVKDAIDSIRGQVEDNLNNISDKSSAKIDTINTTISDNTYAIRDDILKSYNKLIEVQANFDEIKEALKLNNLTLTTNVDSVLETADSVKADFEVKLATLKNNLLDKVSEFKKEFTCENADNISEIKFNSESLHAKALEQSLKLKDELCGEIESIADNLKLKISDLKENIASATLKVESSNNGVVNYIKDDFATELNTSLDEFKGNVDNILSDINSTAQSTSGVVNELELSIKELSTETKNSLAATLAKVLDNFVSLKSLINTIGEQNSEDMKYNAESIKQDFSELKQRFESLDSMVDDDLSRQFTLFERNFDTLTALISNETERNAEVLSEHIDAHLKNTSDIISEALSEKLDEYKAQIETIFDNLKLQGDSQADYIKEKVSGLNRVLESAIENQNKTLAERISEISLELNDVLSKNIDITREDYDGLKDKLIGITSDIESNNSMLVDSLKEQIGDMTKYIDSGIVTHAQDISSKIDDLSSELNDTTAKIKDLSFELNNTTTKIDDLSSEFNNTNLKISNIESGVNDKISDSKEEIISLQDNFFNKVETANNDFLAQIKSKMDSIKEYLTEDSETRKETDKNNIEAIVSLISDELSGLKQNTITYNDVMTSLLKEQVNILSSDIHKETNSIVNDLLEQFAMFKDAQKDDISTYTDKIENTVEGYIVDAVNDLKSYYDVKTDSTILNSKLDNLRLDMEKTSDDVLENINKLLDVSVFSNAIDGLKNANEVLISSMADKLNKQIQTYINENVTETLESSINTFDQNFINEVVREYDDLHQIAKSQNEIIEDVSGKLDKILEEFGQSTENIEESLRSRVQGINDSVANLTADFAELKNKLYGNTNSTGLCSQVNDIESLVKTQLGYIDDINELCCNSLPEIAEIGTLVKHGIMTSLNEMSSKVASSEDISHDLSKLKSDIITQLISVFNQISFVTEQEEILDFIQEKHDELITIFSHIVTTSGDFEAKVDSLKGDINNLNEKINSIISSDGNVDYIYSLQDLESDIANLRVVLNEMKTDSKSKELDELVASTNNIYELVEAIKAGMPNLENLADDIVSISSRTNKLLLSSDESYKTLQDNLQDFKLVINDLDERTRNFAQDAGLDKIDSKLGAINTMIQNGAKTNQVFNQVFEYLAEWVDNAGAKITAISDKVETLDDIGQIKVMLEDLKAEAEDTTASNELIEAMSNVFDKQTKRISSLESKLDRIIVDNTINAKNNKLDLSPMEETLNRFLVAMDDKIESQQKKIDMLEAKLSEVVDNKDTAQLTKKVGGMDRQIAKLNKSIEKIASHVVEK